MKKSYSWYSILLLLFVTFSCSTIVTTVSDAGLKDNLYDHDFFQIKPNISLDKLVSSVKMLNCMAYYESYHLNRSSKIKLRNIFKHDLKSAAINIQHSTETASGTATIIYSYKGKVALLTAAHIISFPDTLITYFRESDGSSTDLIESISIKKRQSSLLPEFSVSSEVNILAIDPITDIAIIGRDVSTANLSKYTSYNLTLGNGKELSWGTKVYMIGYPLNNKMITTGLVSPSQINGKDYFFVDAVFNKGFSGGLVLAVRDGAPNFELVGMVKSGTVHRNFNIIPNSNKSDFVFQPHFPYKGELLVEENTEIKYGVTKIMTVETITNFINDKRELLEELGYKTSRFFKN